MSDTGPQVLIVDDEVDLAESCAFFLRRAGFTTETANSGEQAMERMAAQRFALVITDIKMPRMSGLQLLEAIKAKDPDVEVVMITGHPEVDTAVQAMRNGALDYITKPFEEEALLERVEKACAHRVLRDKNQDFKERMRQGSGGRGRELVSRSEVFAETLAVLERAGKTDASVLILGESGTGKELLAHHLHDVSNRAERPFVPVDCTALPENLVESELFGHVKGAFSGATGNKMGLFQVAHGGTLFLDEVGELPLTFQPKLLRAIQERQVRRVGGNDYLDADVRLVCATNRRLDEEVAAGRFRQDLFYRLDVIRVDVPPLRQRIEDVDPLARHFLAEFIEENPACSLRSFSDEAMLTLRSHSWPGNVRELRNAVQRAATLGSGDEIRPDDLPEGVRSGGEEPDLALGDSTGSFQEMKARKVAALESTYVESLLRRFEGNVTRCAEEAGMARSAFQKLMQRYDIKSSDFRA